MKYSKIKELRGKLFFSVEDVAEMMGIKSASARMLCNRYVKGGLFMRVKRNFYVLEQRWKSFVINDFLMLSNYLQVPSYVSFTTALSYYGITTQVQRGVYESASLKRSVSYEAENGVFRYYKLKKEYFLDFVRKDNIIIATPEKAFLDIVYLNTFGKYSADFGSMDQTKLDLSKIKTAGKIYPPRTRELIKKICGI